MRIILLLQYFAASYKSRLHSSGNLKAHWFQNVSRGLTDRMFELTIGQGVRTKAGLARNSPCHDWPQSLPATDVCWNSGIRSLVAHALLQKALVGAAFTAKATNPALAPNASLSACSGKSPSCFPPIQTQLCLFEQLHLVSRLTHLYFKRNGLGLFCVKNGRHP